MIKEYFDKKNVIVLQKKYKGSTYWHFETKIPWADDLPKMPKGDPRIKCVSPTHVISTQPSYVAANPTNTSSESTANKNESEQMTQTPNFNELTIAAAYAATMVSKIPTTELFPASHQTSQPASQTLMLLQKKRGRPPLSNKQQTN